GLADRVFQGWPAPGGGRPKPAPAPRRTARAALALCWLAVCAGLSGWLLRQAAPAPPPDHTVRAREGGGAAAPSGTTRRLLTKPIEDVRVGDRVLAGDPEVDFDSSLGEVIDATWRRLDLVMDEGGPDQLDVVLLRPSSWLERSGGVPGG